MHDAGYSVLVGEFQFGPEISFERFRELEDILKNAVMDALGDFGATHLEFSSCGDYLRFQSQVPDLSPDALRQACTALIPLLDAGVKGRVVCVPGGFGDVDTAFFSRLGVHLVTTKAP
ncbi:hypothetical protein ASZ90_000541 [hydrocarbon metagenome]|uniref:Uncharacterized protein n=1 Tax=hydrocarbon metagenome TaxID=938273 RepID=A0A0W8G8X0_9ZZZZ